MPLSTSQPLNLSTSQPNQPFVAAEDGLRLPSKAGNPDWEVADVPGGHIFHSPHPNACVGTPQASQLSLHPRHAFQLLNLLNLQPLNPSTPQPLNLSTSQPLNLINLQPLNLST